MDIFQENINTIKKRFNKLADLLIRKKDCLMCKRGNHEIKKGKKGYYYIKDLESSYNPIKEYTVKIKKIHKGHYENHIPLVVGMLSASHIKPLLDIYSLIDISIFDLSLFFHLIHIINIDDILSRIRQIFIYDMRLNIFESYTIEENIIPNNKYLILNDKYVKIFYKNYEEFRSYMIRIHSKTPNILVISPIYGGSYDISRYMHLSFLEMGINSHYSEFSQFYNDLKMIQNTGNNAIYSDMMKSIDRIIIEKLKNYDIDIIIGVSQAPISEKVLEYARDTGIRSVFWFIENYRVFRYYKEIFDKYDLFLVFQKGEFLDDLRKMNKTRVHYMPLCAYPSIHKPLGSSEKESEFESDVSFMGAAYENRIEFFRKFTRVINKGFRLWGIGWDKSRSLAEFYKQSQGDYLDYKQIVEIYNNTGININLHSDNIMIQSDDFLNPRTFEICSCGGFQLIDYRKELYEFFNKDEIISFSSLEDCIRKTRYYLKNEKEREEISKRSYERVIKNHTYKHRLGEILSILEL